MNIHLVIHNVADIISIAVGIGVIIFVLVNNPRKDVNILSDFS